MYYVYVIVQSDTGKRYKGNWSLIYYEAFLNKKDALLREKKLKHDGRAKYHLFKRIEHSLAGQK